MLRTYDIPLPRWKLWLIDRAAALLGILVHVNGIPFGRGNNGLTSEPD